MVGWDAGVFADGVCTHRRRIWWGEFCGRSLYTRLVAVINLNQWMAPRVAVAIESQRWRSQNDVRESKGKMEWVEGMTRELGYDFSFKGWENIHCFPSTPLSLSLSNLPLFLNEAKPQREPRAAHAQFKTLLGLVYILGGEAERLKSFSCGLQMPLLGCNNLLLFG